MRVRCRLVLAALAVAPLPAHAGEFASARPVQGMAIPLADPGIASGAPPVAPLPETAPSAPTPLPTTADLTGGRRRIPTLGSGFPSTDGRLPNQRTGPRHEHVVHDICIGC
ncbi:hypothetical protein [Methylobacterium sp. NEAU K]|uniref:hypothetical protein n=1 Tax=Methylobacterium sp. NEAU K TaxID=3064946 RepID=UPI00273341FF|nr:hypothetical protein [Methylobacterium sp. NEAU K]MDP4003737.1 hypothetical protein [Methylobacterium sp. NEAU K]